MNLFGNLSLGFAAFIYLIPLQISLQQPVHAGYRGMGVMLAVLASTLLFWIPFFAAGCVVLAQGGFAWIGNARLLQFLVMLAGCVALATITLLSVGLRGDTQLPWALKPFMPWAIYVLPVIAWVTAIFLLNADPMARPVLLSASRFALGAIGALAIACTVAIATQYAVLRSREIERATRRAPAKRDHLAARLPSPVYSSFAPHQQHRFLP